MKHELSDRERILTAIIAGLSSGSLLRGRQQWSSEAYSDGRGGYYPHFAPWRGPKAGDLVIADTGRIDAWKIAWYVECSDPSHGVHLVREIGSGALCKYGNEKFTPIVGFEDDLNFLEGEQHRFLQKVRAAFRKGDEYVYVFAGLRFDGEAAIITIRQRWADSIPFTISIKWDKRMPIKRILELMREGGYGTAVFQAKAKDSAA